MSCEECEPVGEQHGRSRSWRDFRSRTAPDAILYKFHRFVNTSPYLSFAIPLSRHYPPCPSPSPSSLYTHTCMKIHVSLVLVCCLLILMYRSIDTYTAVVLPLTTTTLHLLHPLLIQDLVCAAHPSSPIMGMIYLLDHMFIFLYL
jgi:hypothetical protein